MKSPVDLAQAITRDYLYQLPVNIEEIVKAHGVDIDYILTGDEFNGLYMRYPSPSIAINARQSLARQRFTLAHELFHHLTCDKGAHTLRFSTTIERTADERRARIFSANALMPEPTIRLMVDLGCRKDELAKALEVSGKALDIRLRSLRIEMR